MINNCSPINSTYSEADQQAALTIQCVMRRHWSKQRRVFASERLDKMSEIAKESIESFGFIPLTLNKNLYLPAGMQPICALVDPVTQTVNGLYRFPSWKKEDRSNDEHACQELIRLLGFSGSVYRSKLTKITLDMNVFWDTYKKYYSFSVDVDDDSVLKIFNASTLEEAIDRVRSLPQAKRDEFWKFPPDILANMTQGDHFRLKIILRTILYLADPKKNPDASNRKVHLPLLLMTSPGTTGLNQKDVDCIPKAQAGVLAELLGKEKLEPSLMEAEFKDEYRGLKLASYSIKDREHLFSLVSQKSFEQLMGLSLLFGLPSLDFDQLTYAINHQGELDLSLIAAPLKVYPNNFTGVADQNCLALFPHMDYPISSVFAQQISRWDSEDLINGLELPGEQKQILQERMCELQRLIASDIETWEDLVKAMRPDWISSTRGIEGIRRKLWPVHKALQKINTTQVIADYEDVLFTKPKMTRKRWREFNAYKEEIDQLVNIELMPRVIKIIEECFARGNSKIRRPFLKEEDCGDIRKYVGLNCCGPASIALSILLRANGINARTEGSGLQDHTFVGIPTEFGQKIHIDPTYKQMFFRSERQNKLYWHSLPPAFVGSSKDLREFASMHKNNLQPYKNHRWINASQRYNQDKTELSIKSRLIQEVDADELLKKGHDLEGIIKKALSEQELEQLKRMDSLSADPFDAAQKKIPEQPLCQFIEDVLTPYLRRVLYHGTPTWQSETLRSPQQIWKDNATAKSIFSMAGYLIKEAGYEVHFKTGLKLENILRLETRDTNGNCLIVIPCFLTMLHLFDSYFPEDRKVQMAKLPQTFVGTKQELEQVIKNLLGDEELKHFPQGYQIEPDSFNIDHLFDDFALSTQNHAWMRERFYEYKLLIHGIVNETVFAGNPMPKPLKTKDEGSSSSV